jgi:L-serine dehydratase
MSISTFELFKIGIGPSSSHTVGPMRAARQFILDADKEGILKNCHTVKVELYGSLALTGKGHATDIAVMVGLMGEAPDTVDPDRIPFIIADIRYAGALDLAGKHRVHFNESFHLLFHYKETLPHHPNGMRFSLIGQNGKALKTNVYYSVGGGFVVDEASFIQDTTLGDSPQTVPYPFKTAAELLTYCQETDRTIAQVMFENEKVWRSETEIRTGLLNIWQVMKTCIERGCKEDGVLPGGLRVKRRAAQLKKKLLEKEASGSPRDEMNWVNLYALAVNEENAAGGRVVTAPTNGAAGIIPAVLNYYLNFVPHANESGIIDFLLTAGAIGILFKEGASISAAEVGCQGEVGVACSMAAGALCAVMGGSVAQVENAAEIGIEHHLGLTCDPIGGLVQIPCIERNTMGSIQAINSAKLSLMGDGEHFVSLDQAIAAMRQTGHEMSHKYKETALAGLAIAVSQPAC